MKGDFGQQVQEFEIANVMREPKISRTQMMLKNMKDLINEQLTKIDQNPFTYLSSSLNSIKFNILK